MTAVTKNEAYLAYVKQAAVGAFMGSLRFVADKLKCTPHETLQAFFLSKHQDQSLDLTTRLLNNYIQTCCDEFCTTYHAVYIKTSIPLRTALALNGDYYIFSHFNKIFRDSRSELVPGPRHLNCLAVYTLRCYMPLLLSTMMRLYQQCSLGGTTSSQDGNWSEAEKNVVRAMLQGLAQTSIDWLNENDKHEELNRMPFACQDNSCNQNWDLFNFSKKEQIVAIENIKKLWDDLEAQETD
ncbi:unnamed protein product [Adineta ricciae]|uniref:Uncharacterized protein n=1 Tax=Adineta ricciae TaxID=249248 RepID=A0A814BQE5_ADIRI|nr:unnamed protein product [Adineta ricciae]CAF1165220.1 unnamed protein product [Adineta ricciae]